MSKQPVILLVSSSCENEIAEYTEHLSARRMRVEQADLQGTALNYMERRGLPHLILVDLDTRGADSLLRRLRHMPLVPVIAIGRAGDKPDVALAALQDADDYVRRTEISPQELMMRCQRVLARIKNHSYAGKLPLALFDWMTFDPLHRQVVLDGESVLLTPTENALLSLLVKHRGDMVDAYTITERVWHASDDAAKLNALRVHMHRLRTKIESAPGERSAIRTDRGIGYSLAG